MIRKFEAFNRKSIAVYHGYGGEPSSDRIRFLESVGFSTIHYPYIDFDEEWELDKCKSIFERELKSLKKIDILIGVSLGGYLAFELAGNLSKDLVLINPALDRKKTKLDIKFFDIKFHPNVIFGAICIVFLPEGETIGSGNFSCHRRISFPKDRLTTAYPYIVKARFNTNRTSSS